MSDYNKMTVVALKALLKKRGLDDSGWKSALMERLRKNDDALTEPKAAAAATTTTTTATATATATATVEKTTKEPEPKKKPAEQEKSIFDDPSDSEPEKDEEGEKSESEKTPAKKQESAKKKTPMKKAKKPTDGKKVTAKDKVSGTKKEESKKWVDILEQDKDTKIIMRELKKINKLDALKQWNKEIQVVTSTNRIRIFPISPDDLSELVIVDLLEKAEMSTVKLFLTESPNKPRQGWLELSFLKSSEKDEAIAAVKEFRENVVICQNTEDNINSVQVWNDQWTKFSNKPNREALDKFRLFAPSLPQSVTEEDMWNFFPTAIGIILIAAKPRKHAYLNFPSEEIMKKAVENLNARGPPRDDLKFARLLRITDLQKLGLAQSKEKSKKGVANIGPKVQQRGNRQGRGPPQISVKPLLTGRRPMPPSNRAPQNRPPQNRPPPNRAPLMATPHGRVMPQDRRHPGAPSRNVGPPPIQNAFAQLEGPNMDVSPQVIDTLQTILGHVGGQGPNATARSQAPQPLMGQGPPMKMRDIQPPRPNRDQQPQRDNRRMDNRGDHSMKRAHSPVMSYMDTKRSRDRYDEPHGIQQNYSSQSMSSMRDSLPHQSNMRDDYERPQIYPSSNLDRSNAPQSMDNLSFGQQNRDRDNTYHQGSRSTDYMDSRPTENLSRNTSYNDSYRETSDSTMSQSYESRRDEPYRQTSSSNMPSSNSSAYSSRPDFDYRHSESRHNMPYTPAASDRLSSALDAVSKIKQFKESLTGQHSNYPSGASGTNFRSSYY